MLKKMNEKLSKWVTPKSLAVFLTIVYVAGLVPLLWIGWYNYPSADDTRLALSAGKHGCQPIICLQYFGQGF